MNLLVLSSPGKTDEEEAKKIAEEAKEFFDVVNLVPAREVIMKVEGKSSLGFKIYYKNLDLLKHDYVLPRLISPVAGIGYHILKYFETFSMRMPYDAEALLIAHNKFATLYNLKSYGLPVPMTYYTSSKEAARRVLRTMNYPIVIKLVGGFEGKGVMFADTMETAESIINTLNLLKQDLVLEEFIENPGEDIRILTIGDDYFAIKRVAKKGEKRANVSLGAEAVKYKPTEEQVDMAFKAANRINCKICGVDIIEGRKGDQIIEVNISPGIKGISRATNVNIAKKIAEFCYKEAKR